MIKIAIDIDNTLRDFGTAVEKWIEIDHPDKLQRLLDHNNEWNRLNRAFNDDREAVEKWMWEERVFQLFGQAPKVYPDVIEHVNALAKRADANPNIELWLASVQRLQSITATLFWLAKNGCRAQNIKFYTDHEQKNEDFFDYVIDDKPSVLEAAKENGSTVIVAPQPYNEHLTCEKGFHRLNYSGTKPTGIAAIANLVGLGTYSVIEGD